MTNSFGPVPSKDNFGFLLMETARMLRQTSERFVEENGIGLTPGDIRTLGYVMRYKGSRQIVLAERMGIEPMSLSAFLDRLEARDLIERRTDPSDRRAKLIEPTAKATGVVVALDPTFEEIYQFATRGLGKAEMDELAAGLRVIRSNLATDPTVTEPFSLLPEPAAPAGG